MTVEIHEGYERARASSNASRARRFGVEVDMTGTEWLEILSKSGLTCFYCLDRGWYERRTIILEHFIPLSKGGAHAKANVVPACPSCNVRKGNLHPAQFLIRLEWAISTGTARAKDVTIADSIRQRLQEIGVKCGPALQPERAIAKPGRIPPTGDYSCMIEIRGRAVALSRTAGIWSAE